MGVESSVFLDKVSRIIALPMGFYQPEVLQLRVVKIKMSITY